MLRPLLALLLLFTGTFACQAATPAVSHRLIGKYIQSSSAAKVNGELADDFTDAFDIPIPVKANYLKELEAPGAINSLARKLQQVLRDDFPDARVRSTKTGFKAVRISGGFSFYRTDALTFSIPSVNVQGTGTLAVLGTLTLPGKLIQKFVVRITLTGPGGTAKMKIVIKLVHRKKA